MLVELVRSHHSSIILARDCCIDLLSRQIDSEVQITEENLAVVVLGLIALVLSATLALECLLRNKGHLLVSLIDISLVITAAQVTIQEHECGVFESEAKDYCTLVTGLVGNLRLDSTHGDIEDACLDLRFSD